MVPTPKKPVAAAGKGFEVKPVRVPSRGFIEIM